LVLTGSVFGSNQSDTPLKYHYYLVHFDGKDAAAEPALSSESIRKRRALGIEIDPSDYPVNPQYINQLRRKFEIMFSLRWQNAAVIVSTDSVPDLDSFRFVVGEPLYLGSYYREATESQAIYGELEDDLGALYPENEPPAQTELINEGYGESFNQISIHGGHWFHRRGWKGQGVKIAVLDAGFHKANRLPAFRKLFTEGRVKWTWDLYSANRDVFNDDDHGTHVLSCLAAYDVNRMIGTAPLADYYLFRTEFAANEQLLEEVMWARAAELADSIGVDVINSSLGYTYFDHPVKDHSYQYFDGKSTLISRAAQMAIDKGIVVVNSAGNDGDNSWKKIGAPADVEGVITVGGISASGTLASFSSKGPTADGRIKPDVVGIGYKTLVASTFGSYYNGNGTSYSSPIIAGLVACLLQAMDTMATPEQIHALLRRSAGVKGDTLFGYGIPNMPLALLLSGRHPQFDYTSADWSLGISEGDTLIDKPYIIYFDPTSSKESDLEAVVEWSVVKRRWLFFKKRRTISSTTIQPFEGFYRVAIPKLKRIRPEKYTVRIYQNKSVGNRQVVESTFTLSP
jgi:subtilisin family serine protease